MFLSCQKWTQIDSKFRVSSGSNFSFKTILGRHFECLKDPYCQTLTSKTFTFSIYIRGNNINVIGHHRSQDNKDET